MFKKYYHVSGFLTKDGVKTHDLCAAYEFGMFKSPIKAYREIVRDLKQYGNSDSDSVTINSFTRVK